TVVGDGPALALLFRLAVRHQRSAVSRLCVFEPSRVAGPGPNARRLALDRPIDRRSSAAASPARRSREALQRAAEARLSRADFRIAAIDRTDGLVHVAVAQLNV